MAVFIKKPFIFNIRNVWLKNTHSAKHAKNLVKEELQSKNNLGINKS